MQLRNVLSAVAVFVFLAIVPTARAQEVPPPEELTCEDYRCQFQEALESKCRCTEAENHGRFVSCVAKEIKLLVAGGMPVNCKGKLQRCAARSVCGKQARDFHTCTTTEYAPCDLTTGFCTDNPLVACTADSQCGVVSTRCKISRNPTACSESGGVLDLSPSCCSKCNTAALPQ